VTKSHDLDGLDLGGVLCARPKPLRMGGTGRSRTPTSCGEIQGGRRGDLSPLFGIRWIAIYAYTRRLWFVEQRA